MSDRVAYLLAHSNLPGPRGNLELLHSFAHSATGEEVRECLSFFTDTLSNSPEEFVVMCGVVGTCILESASIPRAMGMVRPYASHSSWRIREAVAIGIQEIGEGRLHAVLDTLEDWTAGNDFERRAVVAALCEPKLLVRREETIRVLDVLTRITAGFERIDGKLSEGATSLRKALGYGWSVAVVSRPVEGKAAFERIAESGNRNVRWIVKENLGKHRLEVMDADWTGRMKSRPASAPAAE